MTDFGSLFDNAKIEADKERADTRARLQSLQDEKKARLDERMRSIISMVDPVFRAAAAQLSSKDVKLKQDVNDKLLFENSERKAARSYQFRLGFSTPGSVYHFLVLPQGFIVCTVYPYDHQFSSHHSGKQVLRCKVEELTSEMIEDVVRSAVEEVGRSR